MNPGGKGRTAFEAVQVAPHLQHRVLHGILGIVAIAEYLHRDGQGPRPDLFQKRTQGLRIASLCLLCQK